MDEFDYTVFPNQGIGPIKLGMTRAEVLKLVQNPRLGDQRNGALPRYFDVCSDQGLKIHYELTEPHQVIAVEIVEPEKPAILNGLNMMKMPEEKFKAGINQLDPDAEVDDPGVFCPNLGMYFYFDEDPAAELEPDYDLDAEQPNVITSVSVLSQFP